MPHRKVRSVDIRKREGAEEVEKAIQDLLQDPDGPPETITLYFDPALSDEQEVGAQCAQRLDLPPDLYVRF